ncbi:MAG: transglutaminase N-terminal domain-containing protein [Pseudorhodoferax sp.]
MFRPRDSHDLRVLATDLQVSPAAAVRLIQDPHSNSVALVQPEGEATELSIVCAFTVEHVPSARRLLALDRRPSSCRSPTRCRTGWTWSTTCARTTRTPTACCMRWAHQFLRSDAAQQHARDAQAHERAHPHRVQLPVRDEEGTQTPLQTLAARAAAAATTRCS